MGTRLFKFSIGWSSINKLGHLVSKFISLQSRMSIAKSLIFFDDYLLLFNESNAAVVFGPSFISIRITRLSFNAYIIKFMMFDKVESFISQLSKIKTLNTRDKGEVVMGKSRALFSILYQTS